MKARSTPTVLVAALAAFALFVSACSGGGGAEKAAPKRTTTTPAPTTTTVAPPIAPLTGQIDISGALTRPALSVKVENTPEARPQGGIDVADVVYEEVVEGDITRFVAMFNSTVPGVVGPVRSVRAMDPDIVWPVGGIFAYSGGAPVNVDAINAAPVHAIDENNRDVLVRNEPSQPRRSAPHNLYGLGQPLFDAGGDPKPPPALFQYIANDAPPIGPQGVIEFRVGFARGYDPVWTWDGATNTWKRSIGGVPQTVVGGAQIAPTNVVIQFTPYAAAGEGTLVGEGDVWVFTDGVLRMGRWQRPDRALPAKYVDGLGIPIALRPGRTWVELLPAGSAVDVVAAPPPPPTTVAPATTAPPTTAKKKKKAS